MVFGSEQCRTDQNKHKQTLRLGRAHIPVVNRLLQGYRLATYDYFPYESCPDWAFRNPCPYTTVFEAKLFRKGEIEAAKTELVKAIYQCMFYRGQREIPEINGHPGWHYEYACLMAYDASEKQSLVEAWKTVRPEVRDGCWDSSNIFVMVLPSQLGSV